MFLTEEKLPVKVTQVDGIEVDDINLGKFRKNQVLQQFASNATSTNH